MTSERFRPFTSSMLALGVAVLVAGCAALQAALPDGRLTLTTDAQRVAQADVPPAAAVTE